jgi:hypothetical protein
MFIMVFPHFLEGPYGEFHTGKLLASSDLPVSIGVLSEEKNSLFTIGDISLSDDIFYIEQISISECSLIPYRPFCWTPVFIPRFYCI